jgi:hypothetical protein
MVRTARVPDFFYQCRVRSPVGHGTIFMPGINRLGANALRIMAMVWI